MAISYVGGQSAGRTNASAAASVNFALSGGSNATPQSGDLVIVCCVTGSAAGTPAMAVTTPSGYTALTQLNQTATTNDTSLNVSYKRMTATPDTAVTIPGSTNNAWGEAYSIQVFRGVDSVNPLDVTSVSAGATATGRPDPGSITPITPGAYVVICAGGSATTGAVYTAPANYTTNFETKLGSDTTSAMVGSGYRAWTSGAENPAVYTGGTTNAIDSWASYTLALRPGQPFLGSPANLELGASHTPVKVENLGFVTPTATNLLLLYSTTGDLLRNGIDWPNPIVSKRAAQPPAVVPNLLTSTLGFPQQPILDDFNRANESPLSGGGNWVAASFWWSENGLILISNRAGMPAVADFPASTWTRRFDANFEVYVSVPVLPALPTSSTNSIYIDLSIEREDQPVDAEGYFLRLDQDTVGSFTLTFRSQTAGLGFESVPVTFSAGDAFGLKQEGTTYHFYIRHNGAWSRVGSVTDATYAAPFYATLVLYDFNGSPVGAGRLDDFGGGPISPLLPGAGQVAGSSTATAVGGIVREGVGSAAGTAGSTVVGDSAFPSTAVLDDFNRANETPLSGNWLTADQWWGPGLALVSNRAGPTGTTDIWQGSFWYRPFATDFEVYVSIPVLPVTPSQAHLLLDLTIQRENSSEVASLDGYYLRWSYASGGVTLSFRLYTDATASSLGFDDLSVTFSAGDAIGVRKIGSLFRIYARHSGTWTLAFEVTDATHAGPFYATLGTEDISGSPKNSIRLDDFGGGPLATEIPAVASAAGSSTATATGSGGAAGATPSVQTQWPNPVRRAPRQQPISLPRPLTLAAPPVTPSTAQVRATVYIPRPKVRYPVIYDFPSLVTSTLAPSSTFGAGTAAGSSTATGDGRAIATTVGTAAGSSTVLGAAGLSAPASVINVSVPSATVTPVVSVSVAATAINVTVPSATVTPVVSLTVAAPVTNVTVPSAPALKLTIPTAATTVSVTVPSAPAVTLTIPVSATVVNVTVPAATVTAVISLSVTATVVNVTVPSAPALKITIPIAATTVNVSITTPTVTTVISVAATAPLTNVSVPTATVTPGAISVAAPAPTVNVSAPTASVAGAGQVVGPEAIVNVSVPTATLALTMPVSAVLVNVSVPAAVLKLIIPTAATVVNVTVPTATVTPGAISVSAPASVINVTVPSPTVTAVISLAATAPIINATVPTATVTAVVSVSVAATVVNASVPAATVTTAGGLAAAAAEVNVSISTATTIAPITRAATAAPVDVSVPTAARVAVISLSVLATVVNVTTPNATRLAVVSLPIAATTVNVTVPTATVTAGAVSRAAPAPVINVTAPTATVGAITVDVGAAIVSVTVPPAVRQVGGVALTQVATQVSVSVPAVTVQAIVSLPAAAALTTVQVPAAVTFGYVTLTAPATVVQVSVPLAGRVLGPVSLVAGTVVLVSVTSVLVVLEITMDELLVSHGRLISSWIEEDLLSGYVLDEVMTL